MGCADFNVTHCRVLGSECLNSFAIRWLLLIIWHWDLKEQPVDPAKVSMEVEKWTLNWDRHYHNWVLSDNNKVINNANYAFSFLTSNAFIICRWGQRWCFGVK